jgi:uncharacterized protein (TIGR02271 family)
LRVQRTEEVLAAVTREREAGQVSVRKRVCTDRERLEVPTRHEEVSVERVPVEEGAATTEAQRIGEVRVPLTEEEEVRIRKNVVEDTEVVEEDVRREEIDVDDQTARGV